MAAFSDRLFYALVAVGVLLNATGLLPPILEPDGALYACIAKTMAQSGDFINLYAVGTDWLDKPHFPFWIAAVSFKIFGVNTFAYKFPALLFFLGGVVYTYQFAQLTHSKLVAQVAVLVLLTAFHGVLSNSDVRAEPYLTGLIIGAVYHFWRVYSLTPPLPGGEGLLELNSFSPSPPGRGRSGVPGGVRDMLLGSFLTGCALMTKGLFVLVPIGAGLVFHWLLTGHWRELLRPRWYVAVLLSCLFTLPEIYCLYQQFDFHPEKVIFGQTGVSGVRFFFWDSQFGRFFNSGPIRGEGDKLFFVHTLLWAFLPWSLPLYTGVGQAVIGLVKRRSQHPEYVSLGSGLVTFALFSLSGFQLPHYMNIVFPFFAIITARFLVSLTPANLRRWTVGQTLVGVLLIALSVALVLLVRPAGLGWALSWVALIMLTVFFVFRTNSLPSLMGRMVGSVLVFFVALNGFLYPMFLQYQAGMTAALAGNKQPKSEQQTLLYMPGTGVGGGSFWSFEFYANGPTRYVRSDSALRAQLRRGSQLVFTSAEYTDSLTNNGFGVHTLAVFPYYHVSQLTYQFLNPATRAQTLLPYVLAEVKSERADSIRNRTKSVRKRTDCQSLKITTN